MAYMKHICPNCGYTMATHEIRRNRSEGGRKSQATQLAKYGQETIDSTITTVPEGSRLVHICGRLACLFPDGRWMSNKQLLANRKR